MAPIITGIEFTFSPTDAMMIAMCIPNVIALYILCPEIKRDVIEYVKKFKVSKIFANENAN